jgi:hypothetical protein
MVLHLVEDGESGSATTSREAWVDVERDLARVEETVPPGQGVGYTRGVLSGGTLYEVGMDALDSGFTSLPPPPGFEAARCDGASAAASIVLPCPDDDGMVVEEQDITVERNERDGRDFVDLVTTTTAMGSNEGGATVMSTVVLSLDAGTLLPVSRDETGEIRWHGDDTVEEISAHSSIEAEFVPLDGLPSWFFDPGSLAMSSHGPIGMLDAMTADAAPAGIYWLGESWDAGGGLPAVGLVGIGPAMPDQDAGSLQYGSQPGVATLVIQQIPVDLWGQGLWADPERVFGSVCAGPTELANGGEYTFYCSGGPVFSDTPSPEEGSGVVVFPDAVVVITSTFPGTPTGPADMPFLPQDAVTAVAEALRPY